MQYRQICTCTKNAITSLNPQADNLSVLSHPHHQDMAAGLSAVKISAEVSVPATMSQHYLRANLS